jgi:hypothetical protein
MKTWRLAPLWWVLVSCAIAPLEDEGKLCSSSRGCAEGYSCVAGACHSGPESPTISPGSVWKYRDDGLELGTTWRGISFDDSGWNEGPAPLGYGTAVVTTVCCAPPSASAHVTNYFRRSFNVEALPSGLATLGVRRDDAAVVFLNGTEVLRSNLPSGTLTGGTQSSTHTGSTDEETFFTVPLQPSQFVIGRNVLAIEIHQESATSSDAVFDLELSVTP